MEKVKQIRFSGLVTAVLVIAAGILMMIFQDQMIYMLARVIGAVVALVGILQLIRGLTDHEHSPILLSVSAVITAFGLWMLFFPGPISKFIPIVLGVLLVIHGIDTVSTAWTGKRLETSRWILMLLSGIISIVLGAVCILKANWLLKAGMIVLGIMLVYDGVSALVVNGRVAHAQRVIDSTARDIDEDEEV
ncbi:MAG TPA: hypothetical protein DCP96_04420 [Lachnospiraceae bacterium]|jgi:uncharacterized membrane protein HdeD (DUF308 family)|nr:DUF308 domain-containing protein [Lachnospiraceae bacterium]MDD6148561.1 DUF308 domain-containing protein [Lachnospiraceae bacterium]MDY5704542.1 DUF308 domain-containing protein [Lachnospiraceae bacterium]MEE3357100.1 DUF308 domain-containing protein [Lachnospiraceae bacterium]HAN50933.1 hypothetical protein [Lachnospiraceae bacterium]